MSKPLTHDDFCRITREMTELMIKHIKAADGSPADMAVITEVVMVSTAFGVVAEAEMNGERAIDLMAENAKELLRMALRAEAEVKGHG